MVVAPALMAASTQRARKSASVRLPSSADHSTSATKRRARVTEAVTASSTERGSIFSLYFMCSGEVLMKVWMRGRSAARNASAARLMSPGAERARPQMTGPRTAPAMACTLSKSPGEAMGKPASITSAPSSASAWASRNFSARFIEKPGDCSPSRKVVSKTMTRSGAMRPKLGWSMVGMPVISGGPRRCRSDREAGRRIAPERAGRADRFPAQGAISRTGRTVRAVNTSLRSEIKPAKWTRRAMITVHTPSMTDRQETRRPRSPELATETGG